MHENFNSNNFTSVEDEPNIESKKEINKSNIESNELYQKIKSELELVEIAPDNLSENGDLLAPNGLVSNLSEEEWKIVRTPSFKKWFGDWERKYQPEDVDNWAKFQYAKMLEDDVLGYILEMTSRQKEDKVRLLNNKATAAEIEKVDESLSYWLNRKIPVTHEISKINAELVNAGFNPNTSDYGKILDDNGEPLVVYRATNYGPNQAGNFEIPAVGKNHYLDGLGVKVGTFLGRKEEATFHHQGNQSMGKESFLYSCFVNLKNTKVLSQKMNWGSERDEIENIQNKYDGIIVKKNQGDLFYDKKINLMDLIVFNPENILILDVE